MFNGDKEVFVMLRPHKSRFICVQSSVTPEQPHINEWFEMIDQVVNTPPKPVSKKEKMFNNLTMNKFRS